MISTLFKVCIYLLFWQRLVRGLFIFGACLVLPGVMWEVLSPSSAGGLVLMSAGSGIALLFPVILMPLAFRQLISGRHMAMVPNLRRVAGASLLVLCVLVSLWFALLLVLGQHAKPIEMTILLFSALSGYWLLAQWLQRFKAGAIGIWILVMALLQLLENKALVNWAMTDVGNTLVLRVAIAAWIGFVLWLRYARHIPTPTFIINQLQNPELSQQQHQTWLDGKLSFSGMRSASGSVLRGAYDNWRNRFLLHFLAFFLFPVLLNIIFEVLDFVHGSKRQRAGLSTDAWLTMGVFGSTMVSFYTREWIARTRLLWLRSGGSRLQIWQHVSRMTLQETLIALLVSGLYFGMVAQFNSLSFTLAAATTLLCTSVVWFSLNAGHLARLRGWSWVSAIALMMLLILLLVVVIVVAQRQVDPWLPIVVAAGFALMGALASNACKRQFVQVDWCQLRPLIGRASSTLAP